MCRGGGRLRVGVAWSLAWLGTKGLAERLCEEAYPTNGVGVGSGVVVVGRGGRMVCIACEVGLVVRFKCMRRVGRQRCLSAGRSG